MVMFSNCASEASQTPMESSLSSSRRTCLEYESRLQLSPLLCFRIRVSHFHFLNSCSISNLAYFTSFCVLLKTQGKVAKRSYSWHRRSCFPPYQPTNSHAQASTCGTKVEGWDANSLWVRIQYFVILWSILRSGRLGKSYRIL